MDRNDVIRLAKQASCGWIRNGTEPALFGEKHIERFAALVAAAEREACAQVCDALAEQDTVTNYYRVAALAIRARGDA